ncbi:MAG: Asp/Glu racemase [Pseudomonadota bacterium]
MTYSLDPQSKHKLGLIVLSTDETLENEARHVLEARDVALYHSRIFSANTVTRASLRDMETRLSEAAGLLPEGVDVIGYGCTSASVMIGAEGVEKRIQAAKPGVAVTNPMSAICAALNHVGATKIAMLTPYTHAVADPMRAYLQRCGVEIVTTFDFGEEDDRRVARISETSTQEAVGRLLSNTDVDAIFASCTNLRSFGIIESIETDMGVPMLSSNQALLWHMLRLSGIQAKGWGPGRLFR